MPDKIATEMFISLVSPNCREHNVFDLRFNCPEALMVDPYRECFGIPPDHRPPTWYRLLGVATSERDASVIEKAARLRVREIRRFQNGPNSDLFARVAAEIIEARDTLLDPARRKAYDESIGMEALAVDGRRRPNRRAVMLGLGVILPWIAVLCIVACVVWFHHTPPQLQPVGSEITVSDHKSSPEIRGAKSDGSIASAEKSTDNPGPIKPAPDATSRVNDERAQGEANPQSQPQGDNKSDGKLSGLVNNPDSANSRNSVAAGLRDRQNAGSENTERASSVAAQEVKNVGEATTANDDESDTPSENGKKLVRLPVPQSASIDKARQTINRIYRRQLQESDSTSKRALAESLLERGKEAKDEPAGAFVFLEQAYTLAGDAGDLELGMRAVAELASRFEVEQCEIAATLLNKSFRVFRDSAGGYSLARIALEQADRALIGDKYDVGDLLLDTATRALRTEPSSVLKARLQHRRQRLAQFRKESRRHKQAFAELDAGTPSAEANLVVGKFNCFFQGDWENGLAYLAQASESAVVQAASADLKSPKTVDGQIQVAELWTDVAATEHRNNRRHILFRARHWLELAAKHAKGIDRARIDTMLAELPSPTLDLRIRAIVDGHDSLRINSENLQWTHRTWQWPKDVTVNDITWNVEVQQTMPIRNAEKRLIRASIDLSDVFLEQQAGRNRVTISHDADGVSIEFNDHPNGNDAYEVTLRLAKLMLP